MTNGLRQTVRERIVWALLILVLLQLAGARIADARHHRSRGDKEARPSDPQPAAETPSATPAATTPAAAAPDKAATPATASAPVDTSNSQDPCLSDSHCSELYEKARALSRANQYEAALVMYQQTYAMKPLPWLMLNIGRVQQKLGRNEQAAASYRKILDFNAKMPTDEAAAALADVEVTAKAREYLKQAEDAIAEQRRLNPNSVVAASAVDKVPLHKKWWFWTILSGGVGLAAIGVGLGIGLSSSGGPRAPNGVDVLYPAF